jgi:ribonuclease HI
MKLEIYTDGSCIGNPGPGGWAFVILDAEEQILHQASGSDASYHQQSHGNVGHY